MYSSDLVFIGYWFQDIPPQIPKSEVLETLIYYSWHNTVALLRRQNWGTHGYTEPTVLVIYYVKDTEVHLFIEWVFIKSCQYAE